MFAYKWTLVSKVLYGLIFENIGYLQKPVLSRFRKCGTCRLLALFLMKLICCFSLLWVLSFSKGHMHVVYAVIHVEIATIVIWYRTLCYTSLQFYTPVLKILG